MTTGHCRHGEFELGKGCPQCIAERRGTQEVERSGKPHIIKVKYFSETTQELSTREYTYYSTDPLKVGDIVIVPVRDTTGKAKVSAVDVPEFEIASFKDKVKTIPAGSIEIAHDEEEGEPMFEPESPHLSQPDTDITEPASTALALRPGEDVEAHSYFDEARKLLEYAERRVIKTLADAKTATDDLSIISRLKKAMEAKRKEKLAPHEAEVKAIRDTYNYLMTPVLEAERITKAKQTAFLQEQERIRREQEEINRLRMEAAQKDAALHNGEISESVNLVEVIEASERVSTNLGVTGMVDHWVYEVVDFALVPDEYKVIDSALLNAVARKHHDQKPVPGIRFYNEPYLATRTR